MRYEVGYTSWTYATTTYRQAYGDTALKLQVVSGLALEEIWVMGALMMQSTSALIAGVGIGVGSTTANSALIRVQHLHTGIGPAIALYVGKVSEGLQSYYLLEIGNTAVTFYGSVSGSDAVRSGIQSILMA